jgi:hypothetical protein
MDNIFQHAEAIQKEARQVISEVGIVQAWEAVGATVNLIGSLKTGLMINNRDVDFHIYTHPFNLAGSFQAMAGIAENPRIQSISYTNLLSADDGCIEWHASYEDNNKNIWKIDMMHILPESRYAGYFEKVGDRILAVLTPEKKEAILEIKQATSTGKKIPAVLVYQAVIQAGIRDTTTFLKWLDESPHDDIVNWMP